MESESDRSPQMTSPADMRRFEQYHVTSLRPDIAIINRAMKKISILELTIPFETNILKAQERKAAKYAPLVAGLQEGGYTCSFFSIEIGSRGIAAHGTGKSIRSLCGASYRESRDIVKRLCQISLKCSYLIFQERDNHGANFNMILS